MRKRNVTIKSKLLEKLHFCVAHDHGMETGQRTSLSLRERCKPSAPLEKLARLRKNARALSVQTQLCAELCCAVQCLCSGVNRLNKPDYTWHSHGGKWTSQRTAVYPRPLTTKHKSPRLATVIACIGGTRGTTWAEVSDHSKRQPHWQQQRGVS